MGRQNEVYQGCKIKRIKLLVPLFVGWLFSKGLFPTNLWLRMNGHDPNVIGTTFERIARYKLYELAERLDDNEQEPRNETKDHQSSPKKKSGSVAPNDRRL